MITADQLVAHAVGDYILQSDWMATEKVKRSTAALAHVLAYSMPFLFLTQSWKALAIIIVSHFVIDRWRLARYVCWAKNHLAPKWLRETWGGSMELRLVSPSPETAGCKAVRNWPWYECTKTGYPPDRPDWLTVWLLIITDNTLHVLCNGLALKYFG